jgi:murein DD-endopeptidase MepM/ murein hydrolase activator NlpD
MTPRRRVAWLTGAVLLLAVAHALAEPRMPAAPPPRSHVVGQGDTLGAIAVRYKVTVPALVAANRLPNDRVTLRLGQRLVIPAAAPPAPTAASKRPPSTAAVTPPAGPPTARTVARPRPDEDPRRPPVMRGPRDLELAVPEFVETSLMFTWPVEGPVSSLFGRRRNAWHRGIDIKADPGSVIFAAAPGVVATSAVEPRYGRVVKIEHDGGFVTVYAHNEENLVQAGTRVAAGDPIATVGRTGRATAHHVHFEIRHNGAVYNPLYLLPLPPRVGQVEESDELDEQHD